MYLNILNFGSLMCESHANISVVDMGRIINLIRYTVINLMGLSLTDTLPIENVSF